MADHDTYAQEVDRWGLEPAPLDQVQRSYARADHRPLEHAVRLLLSPGGVCPPG